ncbi:hypothetical protein HGRIS_006940 [Hohenbuehelia grisea]|uniref:O-methyltransferase n=1 Tax=Hohenbuehelia grisea TaxID=104357 RepID=A0ABR3JAN4_9AGAR
MSSLKTFAQQILASVEALEAIRAQAGPASANSVFRMPEPEEERATDEIMAAATSLLSEVRSPMDLLVETCTGQYTTACMCFVNEYDIADIINEAGPKGLHIKLIGEKIGADGNKVGRILRYLAVRRIFAELEPNVFGNNKNSSFLLKGKSVKEMLADPLAKYDEGQFAAAVGIFADEAFRASTFIPQFIKDPGEYSSPFNMAIKDNTDMFSWFNKPENAARGRRFAAGWKGFGNMLPAEDMVAAFDFKALKPGSTVVDVGSNVGIVTMHLAKTFPDLHYVMQDLEWVIKEEAPKYWQEKFPEALTDGRVEFQVHDFNKTNPVVADVYFMRQILHDWPDDVALRILKGVRATAKPTTKLLVFDMIVPHLCAPTPESADAPKFNYSPEMLTMGDMHMMTMQGGCERTHEQFVELGNATGWKLESVKPGPLAALVYTPV